MRKLLILLVVVALAGAFAGCSCAKRSVTLNLKYLADDTQRALGLDEPSGLHSRNAVPWDLYEPYRSCTTE